MIPQSPYYNWRTARESYLRLMRKPPTNVQLNEQIVLMRDMLAILSDLHMQINDLQSENATVTENLEKREEALRRLRELMLGQKEAIQ
jgi:Mg2+ and Co2+ transporter CorA